MTKKYFILALAAFTMAACNNDEEGVPTNGNAQVGEAINPVLLYMAEGTRESMSVDLVNTWVDGDAFGIFSQWDKNSTKDSSLYVNNGMQNARYQYYNSFEYNGQKYTKRWAQDGLLDKTLTPANTVQWAPESKYVDTPYNFYVYFPYTAGATQTAVPFTLKSEQTQTTPDEWSNAGSSSYNFLYSSNKNVTRPADRALPLNMERLLPVAEFNIIRDDESLDDYTLSSVVVKPTDGSTMATGATTINLTNVGNATSVSLGSTAAQYQLNSNIAVNSIAMDNSAALYMSLPPAAAKEYTITATFKKGTDTKTIAVKRTDAYTIEKGKGNIVRYYLKSSNAAAPDTGTPETGSSVTIDGLTWAPANLVYIDNTWRFANTLSECYADTENGTLNNVGPWADYGSKACYWQYGSLTPIDATTVFNKPTSASNNLNTATLGENPWPADTDPCRKVAGGKWRLPNENELTGLSNWLNSHAIWTSVIQNGQTYYGTLSGVKNSDGTFNANSVFIPAAGLYNYTKKFSSVGASGFYWSSEHYVYGDTVWGQTLRTMNNSSEASQDSEAGPQIKYQNQGLSVRCVKTAE